jgi:hypothetical protein
LLSLSLSLSLSLLPAGRKSVSRLSFFGQQQLAMSQPRRRRGAWAAITPRLPTSSRARLGTITTYLDEDMPTGF